MPVAILKAMRERPGWRVSLASRSLFSIQDCSPILPAHLGDVDRRFQRLDLAEEEPAVAVGPLPVLEQAARGAGDARVAALAPVADARADLVDESFSRMRSSVHSVPNSSCLPFFLGWAMGMK